MFTWERITDQLIDVYQSLCETQVEPSRPWQRLRLVHPGSAVAS